MKSDCQFCYSVIYNSVPTGLLEELEQIQALKVASVRMNFTWENREETRKILDLFVEKKKKTGKMPVFTKGHFKRGVE